MQDNLRHKQGSKIAVITCYPLRLSGGRVANYRCRDYSEPVTRNVRGSTGKAIHIATVRIDEVLRVTLHG